MSLFNGTFGSFDSICANVPLIICPIVSTSTPVCQAAAVNVSGFVLQNIGTAIAMLIFSVCNLALVMRGLWNNKLNDLIGHKEFVTFLIMYTITCVFECILYADMFAAYATAKPVLISVYIAILLTTYFMLLFNAFVGFRWIEDGSILSLGLLGGLSTVCFAVILYISLDTALSISGSISPPNTMLIFILYFFFPLVCVVTYVVAQTCLCVFYIFEYKPLIFLFSSFFSLIAGLVLIFFVNSNICVGLSGSVDGIFFSAILVFAAMVLLQFYFDASSQDEFEFDPEGL